MSVPTLKNITLVLCGTSYTGQIERHAYDADPALAVLNFIDPNPDSEDGPDIARLSVCVPIVDEHVREIPNLVCIKDYSGNEGVLAQLIAQDIVRDTGYRIQSDWVTIPVCQIIEEELLPPRLSWTEVEA